VAAGNLAFFFATDGVTGRELWVSDGTASGTRQIADLNPGLGGSEAETSLIRPLAAAGMTARIIAHLLEPTGGSEPWLSDGTAAGTRRIADLVPGIAGSTPRQFVRSGGTVYFVAEDLQTGNELWSLPLTAVHGTLSEPVGLGCPGTGGRVPRLSSQGLPTVGNASFRFTVDNALGASGGVLMVDAALLRIGLPGGCRLYVLPTLTFQFTTDGIGRATLPVPLTDPVLLGVEIFAQVGILDPNGAFNNFASFSAGQRVVIGR
jgi:ELWxxDGT repeat protein